MIRCLRSAAPGRSRPVSNNSPWKADKQLPSSALPNNSSCPGSDLIGLGICSQPARSRFTCRGLRAFMFLISIIFVPAVKTVYYQTVVPTTRHTLTASDPPWQRCQSAGQPFSFEIFCSLLFLSARVPALSTRCPHGAPRIQGPCLPCPDLTGTGYLQERLLAQRDDSDYRTSQSEQYAPGALA